MHGSGVDVRPDSADRGPSAVRIAALTCLLVWLPWLLAMVWTDQWSLFQSHGLMSLTMAAGSFIAGATSEGGGAVAFPVMTLVFGIEPSVARDFGLMIQSVGMTAAAASILVTRIPIVTRALLPVSVGGALGVIVGLEFIAPIVPPPVAKMLFSSTWLAFATALWLMNRHADRTVRDDVAPDQRQTAHLLLFGCGLLGGVITSITSSGVDIVTFSVLVLMFRVSEHVATPTSVVLMAINTMVASLFKTTLGSGMAAEAWSYWWVCVPIVVVGAPLGGSSATRHASWSCGC